MTTLIAREQRIPLAVIAFLIAVILTVPVPGSLSVILTRSLSSAAGIHGIDLISEGVLILLAVGTVVAVAHAWRAHPERRPAVTSGSTGVVLAYVLSELVKLLVAQPRPCQLWALPGDCPALGDWSFPSNHAVLAFGAALVISIATRRTLITWFALSAAGVVAIGRIMQGAHYVHDVALGAALGAAVPAIIAMLALHLFSRTRAPHQRRQS